MGDWFDVQEPTGYLAAALGAISVLVIYGAIFRRGKRTGP
jgi:hypothetical protein